jgi:hypothetical protein
MSNFIPKDMFESGDIVPMCIPDGCIFNLQYFQAGSGLSEQSCIKMLNKYNVRSLTNGRTRWMSGKTVRLDFEADLLRREKQAKPKRHSRSTVVTEDSESHAAE